uniref:NADH-ubiquinone oxidoreductase chain 1 n=1 Tax=Mesenchytraeus solifugus TaxID=223748 RepID=A0A286KAU0_MESSO|nr:NADH dehydrogenase subunit 1 [Mesenchytraeus solifugus]
MTLPFSISFIISYAMALVAMAFYTLMERKFLGYFQLRKGPNKVGLAGLPQPFADAIKLFTKEQSKPTMMNQSPFIAAPVLGLILTLMLWAIFPHFNPAIFLSFGALYFLCVSSMNVYTTFVAGWSSNSKYALLGALRGVAQTISYEVSMSLILLSALILSTQMDMSLISINSLSWIMFMLSPLAIMWFITNLAETNRTPFDFAEGESELVSGFNVEYSSGMFALIFMAEYANILMMSLLSVVFFTGSFNPMMAYSSNMGLILKTMLIATLFIWIRATMPRMRYDHLMQLTWKGFLPLSLAMLMIIVPIMFLF